jgi:protein-S-isoprenylcysteine O-methyltransferase Ste14
MDHRGPPQTDDRPNTKPWPPIIYAAVLVLVWLLEQVVPLPSLPESLLIRWVGAAIFLAAIGLGLAGIFNLRAEGTTFHPAGQASALATRGIYSFSRNPMYLSALVAFVGLGLALRSTWLLVAVPAAAIALQKLAIEPEEAYLERRFGEPYRRYKAHVRRWL